MALKLDNIGSRISEGLASRHMTASELSRKVGVSRAAVGQWIAGTTEPSAANLRRICDALGLNLEWLGQGRGQMIRPEKRADIVPDGVKIDVSQLGDELSRLLLGAMKGRQAEVWRIETDALLGARYHPSDYVVVDLTVTPKARDIVLAYHMQVPIFRMYLPPYLFAAKLTDQPPPLTVDNIQTLVKGVVISRHAMS